MCECVRDSLREREERVKNGERLSVKEKERGKDRKRKYV